MTLFCFAHTTHVRPNLSRWHCQREEEEGKEGRKAGRKGERKRKRRIYLVSLLTSSPHTTTTAICNLQLLPLHQQPLLLLVTIPTSTCPPPSPCPSPSPSPPPCIHIAPPAPHSSSPAPPPHSPLFPHSSTSFPALSQLQTLSPSPKLSSLTNSLPLQQLQQDSTPSRALPRQHTLSHASSTPPVSARSADLRSLAASYSERVTLLWKKKTCNAWTLQYLLAPDLITNLNFLTHLTCGGWIAAPLKVGGSGGGGFVVASTTMASRGGGLAALLCLLTYLLTHRACAATADRRPVCVGSIGRSSCRMFSPSPSSRPSFTPLFYPSLLPSLPKFYPPLGVNSGIPAPKW